MTISCRCVKPFRPIIYKNLELPLQLFATLDQQGKLGLYAAALEWAISSAGEHCLHTAGVAGSIPASPTIPVQSIDFITRIKGLTQLYSGALHFAAGELLAKHSQKCK
jgi:hypothetical protein